MHTKTDQKHEGLRMCLNGRMLVYFIQGSRFEAHHQGGEKKPIKSSVNITAVSQLSKPKLSSLASFSSVLKAAGYI